MIPGVLQPSQLPITCTDAREAAAAQTTWWQSTVGYEGAPPWHEAPRTAVAAAAANRRCSGRATGPS